MGIFVVKMGAIFKGFVLFWGILQVCHAGTGKVDEEEFLIVGGKPSGRGAEFAFSDKDPPKKFERFNPSVTNAIGFRYKCDDEDLYVVTGGYDMEKLAPNAKAYLFDVEKDAVRDPTETDFIFTIPVYQAASAIVKGNLLVYGGRSQSGPSDLIY